MWYDWNEGSGPIDTLSNQRQFPAGMSRRLEGLRSDAGIERVCFLVRYADHPPVAG